MPTRHRTKCLLVIGSVLLGLWQTPAAAREDWYGQLARHWAPVIFQDIDISPDNPLGRYDLITRADFDGDQSGANNWENAADTQRATFPLTPWLYYAVIETRTHYFITYSLFHPRDWSPASALTAATAVPAAGVSAPAPSHENDLESATLVILKDRTWGELRLVGTVCHLSNYCFLAGADIRPEFWALDLGSGDVGVSYYESHPCLFVEAGGHGIGGVMRALTEDSAGQYLIGKRRYGFRGNGGLVYRCADDPAYLPGNEPLPAGAGGAAGKGCSYQLVPIATTLWALRDSIGTGRMFEDYFNYTSVDGCRRQHLPIYFAAEGQEIGANPPWARGAAGDGMERGTWFLDPAYAFNHYVASWPDADREGYWDYLANEFMGPDVRIEVSLPRRERPFVVGYPMRITWQVISGGTTLAEEASLDISRSGGRTWNALPVAAPGATGEAVWTVEGPGSDKCVIALRSPLACEHRFQTSALTPIFSIADAQPYGWVRLDAPAPLSAGSRADAPAAYDAAGDELAVFGGRDTTSHNDLLALGFTDMTWHVLDDGSSAPPARSSHVMVCDSRDNRLVLYGGIGETGLSDTWQFSFESRSWSEITTLGAEVRIGATAIYDPAGDRLVVFGGSDGQALRNDVRALALRGGQTAQGERGPEPWALINSGSGVTPQPRAYAVGGYDAARRHFIIQGGVGGPSGDSALADTWACSLETGQWELLDNGSSECPGGRWQHAGAVDSDRGRLVVFGGRNGAAEYGDVWIFDLDQATWAQVNGGFDQASPPSPAGAAAVFRPGGDQLVVTGGKSDQLSSSGVWSMDLDTTPPGAKQKSKGPDDVVVAAPEVWPNPARDRFAIAVALREPGPITVGIYDVAGRLVRLLGTSVMPAGRCVFYWDCRDAQGMRAASGVYFCRIATPSYVRREPLVVTR